MAKKSNSRSKASTIILCGGGALVAIVVVWSLSSTADMADAADKSFYDDPELNYSIDSEPVREWDEKRSMWLRQHPSYAAAGERILMVTGSQAAPCKNPRGDYLLLKLFKNKVDYARRHGIGIFYNNALLQPEMFSFWAKTPTVKAAMLAHPEAEWIWWVDSDAAFTDMDFRLPLGRYGSHNMVVHGWPDLIYKKRSWTAINAGVFLIRNCQWAMDFMDAWARMGPQHPDYHKWGEILTSTFKDKTRPESDDQSALAYLLLKERDKWGDKIYVESGYYFQGYWVDIVGTLQNITAESGRRRQAEVVSRSYGSRPFVTHFTGCQPCSGEHNEMYSGETCFDAMEMALTFADNQVLRNYGFVHPDLHDPSTVKPLPFDSLA